MKVSQIGLISKKITNLDSQFPVQDMLVQTGQIDQFSSGVYAYGHIPYLVKKNITSIISSVLTKYGCSELSLPLLQPESIWKESGRLEKYVADDIMFRCLTEKGNYCLAPTAEEAVVKYANNRLISYKNLPVTYFQIGEKFRNEIRTRGFLLRGKSFDMMDAYSFGKDQNDLNIEYERMKKAYLEIFESLGLSVQPVGADSGAIGGNKSEEFMCVSDIGEDNILFDSITGKAFNSELLDRDNYKEYLENVYGIKNTESLQTKKAVELGHIFQLGDKYTKAMGATFIAENGKPKNFIMGCYGIGVSRTLAMVYENSLLKNNQNKFEGISLPINIVPYPLYIIPKLDDSDKTTKAQAVYDLLLENGVQILYDDRNELSIGAKLKDSRVVGTPYVAVFGKTLEHGFVTVENNKTGEKTDLTLEQFISAFVELEKYRKNNCSLEEILKKNNLYKNEDTTDELKKQFL